MKKLFALLLVVFLFGGSTMAFAWWDSLEISDDNITIGVGEGVTLEDVTAADFGENTLVPSGVVTQAGQTNSLSNTYTLDISTEDKINDDLKFKVTIEVTEAFTDDNDFDLEEYLVFTIDGETGLERTYDDFEDVFGEEVGYQGDIEIKVEFDSALLDENNSDFRDDIFNSDITFNITFELTE